MKLIHYINAIIYSIFFILSIGDVLSSGKTGFLILAHITLGILQPILALILLTYLSIVSSFKKKLLAIYWLFVISFFVIITFISTLNFDSKLIFQCLSSLPALIASYFVYVTYQLNLK